MKKLVGLIALLLLASGLVTVATPSPAQAACPYTNCIATRTYVAGPARALARRASPYTYRIQTRATRGTARPTGVLRITVRGAGKRVDRVYRNYTGGLVTLRMRFTRTGRVAVRATYTGRGVFRSSSAVKFTQVVRRR